VEHGYANLQTLWFTLIAVLWIGYFFLEGFDFGVGISLPFVSRDETDRRVVVATIGPVWDGNEVWLITAGGAMFAAFPMWYATLFSGFYLALFLILIALILRGVAFEFRRKSSDPTWRKVWDLCIFWGSLLPALLWGVGFSNIVRGVPIDAAGDYVGTFWDLLNPYALLGGVTSLLLFWTHGAVFLGLKTDGEVRERSHHLANRIAPLAALAVVGWLAWTYVNAQNTNNTGMVPGIVPVAAMLAAFAAAWLIHERQEGWAFVATGLTIVLIVATMFLNLYPRVMPSSISTDFDLTIWNSSSSDMTLRLMTIVALVFVPIVVTYQAWTYWVFRRRISRDDFSEPVNPLDVLLRKGGRSKGSDHGDDEQEGTPLDKDGAMEQQSSPGSGTDPGKGTPAGA